MSFIKRTHDCGSLRKEHVGQEVTLNGWVHRVRDLGGLLFIDLRDRTGLVQVMFDPARHPKAEDLRTEFCLSVTGTIKERDDANKNSKMATGDIEMVADAYTALSPAGTLPFQLNDEAQMDKVNEELRVKHRYLDLRRPAMYRKLAIRAAAIRKIRAYLDEREFLEVETPIFTRSTPEGARDYLVPYRLQPGKFYALPQSPQQYKQLLMVAGVERYYQIAKCFRDEAQRADRQPEFTQLDLEMSFVTQEDILQLMEGMTVSMINDLIAEFGLEKDPITGFERMTYDEAMERYGSDKPDIRFGLELFDITEVVAESEFGVFKNCAASGGRIRGVLYPGGAALSRKDVSGLEDIAKAYGAKGLASIAVESEEEHGEAAQQVGGRWVRSSILKFLSETELDDIIRASEAKPGDLICLVADQWTVTCEALNRIRLEIGKRAGLIDKRKLAFAFILDFPLVEWNAEEERWDPSHHPFTSPKTEDLIYIDIDPGKMRADCYDVVCNGVEWASGSIRIHRPDIQSRIFKLIGVGEEEQKSRFGHILEAFSFGAPPHGGIAPGIDRLVMFLTDEENIREVMAFPKVGQGLDPMMGAPSEVDQKQWDEMGLAVTKKPEPEAAEKA